jgi:hypothetical protein
MTTPAARVTSREIAELTAWMRRLTQTGPGRADPAELAAFHAAKAALLARLTAHPAAHPIPGQPPSPASKDTDDR